MHVKQQRGKRMVSIGLAVCGLLAPAWAQSAPAATPAAKPDAKASRIFILGDSLMKGLTFALQGELNKQPGVSTRSCAEIGTGLARLDLFNWHQKISEYTKEFHPDTAVVWMGGNDSQPLKTMRGVLQPGTPEWSAEYGRRVGMAMDLLIGGGVQRIFWLELPDVRDDKLQGDVAVVRAIQAKEVKLRGEVTLLPVRQMLSMTPGKYTQFLIDGGVPVDVRAEDGAHLNAKGAKYVAAKVTPLILR